LNILHAPELPAVLKDLSEEGHRLLRADDVQRDQQRAWRPTPTCGRQVLRSGAPLPVKSGASWR
jgi:hypothetical protein